MTTRKPRTTKPVTNQAGTPILESPEFMAKLVAELQKHQAAVQLIPAEEPKPVEPAPVDETALVIAELKQEIAYLKAKPEPVAVSEIAEPIKVEPELPKPFKVLQSIPFGTIAGWAAAIIGLFLYWQSLSPKSDDAKPAATISSVLDDAYKADRLNRIAILKEIPAKSFRSDQEKLDWINSETDTRRQVAFREFIDRMAKAVNDGTTDKMASDLEAGR
jgi:hypothetical protein